LAAPHEEIEKKVQEKGKTEQMLVLLCFFFYLLSYVAAFDRNTSFRHMNVVNWERYLTCSKHLGFACHEIGDMVIAEKKTDDIVFWQAFPTFDFHRPLIQKRVAHKSLLMFGDSLMRNQFVSLACLLYEADASIATKDIVVHSKFHIKIYSPWLDFQITLVDFRTLFNAAASSSPDEKSSHPNSKLHLHSTFVKELHGHAHSRVPDVTLISTGHQWLTEPFDPICKQNLSTIHNKLPDNCNTPVRYEWKQYESALNQFNSLLSDELKAPSDSKSNAAKRKKMKIVWRSAPPSHYSADGTCASRRPCWQALKAAMNSKDLSSSYYRAYYLSEMMRKSANKFGFDYLDISSVTQDRCDGHRNVLGNLATPDCSHYCVPGVPDMWHEGLTEWL
jgi:hypothetical protein